MAGKPFMRRNLTILKLMLHHLGLLTSFLLQFYGMVFFYAVFRNHCYGYSTLLNELSCEEEQNTLGSENC